MKQITLNWVLAHEPYHVFIKAAKQFAEEVLVETKGEYKINVIDLTEWNASYAGNDTRLTTCHVGREAIIDLVDDGTINMATLYASTLGRIDKDMYALSLPFLFHDHESAQKTLDGEVGQHLLAKVADHSNVRGLAFTYSGGFRIVPSKNAIETLEDFYNMNIGCGKNPVVVDTFKAVGAKPVPMFIEDLKEKLANKEVEGGETTYTRFFILGHDEQTNYINDNEHSLFLTSLVINKQIWQSLSESVQRIFSAAALRAAKVERIDSLNDNIVVQAKAAAQGIPTIRMSAAEKSKFESATAGIYSKYQNYFSPGLVTSLISSSKH